MGVTRRGFLGESVLLASGLAAGVGSASGPRILNQNENMEYRRCGRTGLMVSAVCLGGHWKRIETLRKRYDPLGVFPSPIKVPA